MVAFEKFFLFMTVHLEGHAAKLFQIILLIITNIYRPLFSNQVLPHAQSKKRPLLCKNFFSVVLFRSS